MSRSEFYVFNFRANDLEFNTIKLLNFASNPLYKMTFRHIKRPNNNVFIFYSHFIILSLLNNY